MSSRKPKRIKRKKPLYGYKAFWVVLLAASTLGGFGYFFFFSPVFEITNVRAQGDLAYLEEEIVPLVPRGNIFLFNSSNLQKELEKRFPEIGKLDIQRGLPHTVAVLFQKRVEVAAWCLSQQCLAVDEEGIAFDNKEPRTGFLVRLLDSERVPNPGLKLMTKEQWSVLLDFKTRAENLPAFRGSGLKFLSLEIVSDSRAHWNTLENWEVYINQKENLEWQLQKLQAVLEKQIPLAKRPNLSYIDLRFGDQAYIQYH